MQLNYTGDEILIRWLNVCIPCVYMTDKDNSF